MASLIDPRSWAARTCRTKAVDRILLTPGRFHAAGGPVAAPEGEVLAGDGLDQSGVVQQARHVEELVVDLEPVHGREGSAVRPGAVPMADQGGRLLTAGRLDLTCEAAVGRIEEGVVVWLLQARPVSCRRAPRHPR